MSSLISERMHETRQNLIKEVLDLSYDQFNAKPEKVRWSIAEICHHLVLVELATIKAIRWGLQQKENTEAERKNIHLILDQTRKRLAPKIVEPLEEPFEVQQIIHLLNDSRQKLFQMVLSIKDPSILKKKALDHPAFGTLPLDQWIELVPLHEQRHIKQIKDLKFQLYNVEE